MSIQNNWICWFAAHALCYKCWVVKISFIAWKAEPWWMHLFIADMVLSKSPFSLLLCCSKASNPVFFSSIIIISFCHLFLPSTSMDVKRGFWEFTACSLVAWKKTFSRFIFYNYHHEWSEALRKKNLKLLIRLSKWEIRRSLGYLLSSWKFLQNIGMRQVSFVREKKKKLAFERHPAYSILNFSVFFFLIPWYFPLSAGLHHHNVFPAELAR